MFARFSGDDERLENQWIGDARRGNGGELYLLAQLLFDIVVVREPCASCRCGHCDDDDAYCFDCRVVGNFDDVLVVVVVGLVVFYLVAPRRTGSR